MKIAKAHGYQKNLSHSFIKRFQKKTLEGILGPTPPLIQNYYPIKPLHNPSPPSLFNFEKKSSRKFMVLSLLHIKLKMDNFFSCTD